MWVEGAFRLLPRQLDFDLLGASSTNPFYGAVGLPLIVFGSLALYPLVDRIIYRGERQTEDLLEPWRERPFRTAFGVSGLGFLVLLSLGVLNDEMASVLRVEIWQVNLALGIVTICVPGLLFALVMVRLRRHRRTQPSRTGTRLSVTDLIATLSVHALLVAALRKIDWRRQTTPSPRVRARLQ
jgi:hypothetical protein